jgi:ribonucleoside-diphosphate reductase alpha chain
VTIIKKDEGKRKLIFDPSRLIKFIEVAFEGLPHLNKEKYIETVLRSIEGKEEYNADSITKKLILTALENISREEADWDKIAVHFRLQELYKNASKNRIYDNKEKYGNLFGLLKVLSTKGIYTPLLLKEYTQEEILELGEIIDPSKDKNFNFAGLTLLIDRYLAKDHEKNIYELPQERFMIIAMSLLINERKEKRLELIKEAYWALSNFYMTVATPTLSNAGKSYGQFSSCFIDTIDDSLRGIYDSNTDVATLSKNGGGIGLYFGKIRSLGSTIKGFKGASSGIIPWAKAVNNIAVSVDQLGTRSGAIAIYLDAWHKDIFDFLDLKLNNGDERRRTHDIFTGICLPDLFMEEVEKRGSWYLFDPHEVRETMGWALEDFYDEEKGNGSFRMKYLECVEHPTLSKTRVDAIEIMKRVMKSQLETGTPYMFYRDEANRMNPNKHEGIIYCSNLCTEIIQNMSTTTVEKEKIVEIDGKNKLVVVKEMGDFVVCNLSSINLGKAVIDNVLERLIPIQVRLLDNVIDLNEDKIEVLQAVETNRRYRAIGLGTFGLHHLLALKGIKWESEKAVEFNDALYEKIAFLTIKASVELAKEKGSYPLYKGSEWDTGKYFARRGYFSNEWQELREDVQIYGIRNGYLMAVAPNGSTSIIVGSTASIDPIFKQEYTEEKQGMKIPVIVPDLSPRTFMFYQSAYKINQHWSIKQNAVRQKHIDQALSFNMYVPNNIKAKDLLALHLDAWQSGLKTSYYTRSTSQKQIEECDSCT